MGLTWSWPQAYCLYPFHACLNAFKTAICLLPDADLNRMPSPDDGFAATLDAGATICSFSTDGSSSSTSFNLTASTPSGKFNFYKKRINKLDILLKAY